MGLEAFRKEVFKSKNVEYEFVQDNISSSTKNTVRGLHYQLPPASQAKLVMVPYGEILDVAVDARSHSPTFGKHFSTILSSENRHMMLIPTGYAHGFSVLSEEAVVYYKCNDYYNHSLERGLRWNLKLTGRLITRFCLNRELPLLKEADESDLF